MPRSRASSTFRTSLLILFALVILVWAGPRAEVDLLWTEVTPEAPLDAWLEASEAGFDDLRPGTGKGVVWADSVGRKTPLAVVYLHGFSASRLEAYPYPDSVAKALGANLFYTRLAGHGRDGEALGASTAREWMQSVAEAIRVGESIGDSLIVIGLSTGGSLAAAAAADPALNRRWKAQVWISPYFELHDSRSDMLMWPWGNVLLRIMASEDRSWTPQNDLHAALGTHTYPSKVLLQLVPMVERIREMDLSAVTLPTLMIYSPDDTVVRPDVALEKLATLQAVTDTVVVRRATDQNMHVIVGDALGPENTIPVARRTVDWLRSLELVRQSE
jgi:esterase/lipase